jgi:hypothetical protein
MWRYLNVPQNWEYVGSSWSIALVVATILPEVIYPYVYIKTHAKKTGEETARKKRS